MQTDALIEGMNALGYQVVNLSQREFLHGYETWEARRTKAKFEFISANIVWQDSGQPVVAPTSVRKVTLREGAKAREVRLGFIGLTRNNPAFTKEGPGGRGIVTVDPGAAAEKQLPALRQKSDVIVALVNLDDNEARALAKRVKDIDLILGGNGALMTRSDDFPEDTQIGRTRIFCIGDQGKNLGEVRIFFDAKKRIASTQRTMIGLNREWPENPDLQKLMDATRIAINDYNKAQAAALSPFAPAPPPASTAGSPAAAPAAPVPAYTGSERCAPCHEEAFASWRRSAHARAFATLEKAHQDYNPKCVGCHSIGYGQPRGFVNSQATPGLINVGCEACHGPSGGHPDAAAPGFGRTSTAFCVTCHTRENSPDFDAATYIPKIRHWAEPKPAR